MGRLIYLAVAAVASGALFIPLGPVGLQEANAGPALVPEPSSLLLLGMGLTVLARYFRKP